MPRSKNVRGQTALVTGAGRGIGREIARELGRAGARVVVTDLDLDQAEETVDLVRRDGGLAEGARLNVIDPGQFEAVVDLFEQRLGAVDVLVNNAGIMALGPFLERRSEEDLLQLEVNVLGVAHGMRAVLPRMLARGHGHVVNVASVAGRVGTPFAAFYAASKHAVVGMTEAVRGEHLRSGVDFTVILPALVNTELIAGAGRPIFPPVVEPKEVAERVRVAIERREVEVYIPRIAELARVLPAILPRRLTDALGSLFHVDRMFARIDPTRRAAYVARTTARATPSGPWIDRSADGDLPN